MSKDNFAALTVQEDFDARYPGSCTVKVREFE
jgi:hypothetical protein